MARLSFNEIQVGTLNVDIVDRIMTRLAIAKAAVELGVPRDIINRMPLGASSNGANYEYYLEEKLSDLKELFDLANINCSVEYENILEHVDPDDSDLFGLEDFYENAVILRFSDYEAKKYSEKIYGLFASYEDVFNESIVYSKWTNPTTLVTWFYQLPNSNIIALIPSIVELASMMKNDEGNE